MSGESPRLVSLNVGLPADVEWRGRTVRTGVWKHAVTGPRLVRALNIDGDGQGDLGGHGGPHRAVLVYQLESYDHWARELGRTDFEYGQFGENFTVSGLADDEVCIGDRFEIGGALFEVSQPRVTCYRLGLRMGEPRLPAMFVSHRRPGFYLRVLREGVVQAGDAIVKVAEGPGGRTVAAVDALLYLPGHDLNDVAATAQLTALSPGWRGSFDAMLAAPQGTAGATGNAGLGSASSAPPAWAGFRQVRVAERVEETGTVVSLRLADLDGTPLPAALPGQFLTIRLPARGDLPSLTRNYSISSAPGAPTYRISVKREQQGAASARIHSELHAGDVVEVAAPRGTFTLGPGDHPVVLVSAGIGVTPVLAMLHALAAGHSHREIWWLHGARNGAEHPLAAETRELLAALPGGRSTVFYSAPLPADQVGTRYQRVGRVTLEQLRELALPADAEAYLCGPVAFMTDVAAALVAIGLDPGRVHQEAFGAGPSLTPGIAAATSRPPHQPPGSPGTGPAVTFARSGLTVNWRPDVSNVLELAELCDVPVRWACRTGVCHTCVTPLLAGSVSYDPAPIDEPAAGSVLVCCAAPLEETVVDL